MTQSELPSLENSPKISADFQERKEGQILLGSFVLSERFEDRVYGEGCLEVSVPEEEVQKWVVLSDIYPDSIRWDGENFFVLVNDSYDFNKDRRDRPMYRSSVSLLTPHSDLRILEDDDKEPVFNLSLKSPIKIKDRIEVEKRLISHRHGRMYTGSTLEKYPNYEPEEGDIQKSFLVEIPFEEIHIGIRLEKMKEDEYVVTVLDSEGEEYEQTPKFRLRKERSQYMYGRDYNQNFFGDVDSYNKFLEGFKRISVIPGIKDFMITYSTYDGSVSLDMVI